MPRGQRGGQVSPDWWRHVILSSDWLQGVQGGHVSRVVALGRVVPVQRHVRPRHAGQGAQLRTRGALPCRLLPRGQRGGGVSTISTNISTLSTHLSTQSTLQVDSCDGGTCYGWGAWQPWSSCSASCGTGQRSRQRRCGALSRDQVGCDWWILNTEL